MKRNKDKPLGKQTSKLEKLRQQVGGLEILETGLEFAESETRESREKYQRLFELSPMGIVVLDMKGVIIDCNSAVCTQSGYSKDDFIGKHFKKVATIRAGDIPKFMKIFASLIRGKIAKPLEVTYTRKDGTTGWTEAHISLLKSGGKRIGIQVIQNDTTERKQAQEALRESEQNFRNSLDSSPLGVRIVTAEGELLYANQAIVDIYGYSSVEELKAVPTKQRYTPKSYAEHQERKERRKLAKPGPASYKISIVRKDGEVRHLRVFRREVVWNGETQFQSLYQDNTERRQAEEALERSETKYRGIVETTGSGVATIDSNGVFTFVNKALCNMIGYSDDELVGAPFLDFLHPDDRTSLLDRFQSALEGRLLRKLLEFRVLHRDGAILWWQSAPTPIFDGKEVLGFSAIIYDITERKRAEKRLQQSEENLRAYLESAPDGIYINDLKGVFLYGNKKAEELMGYKREELIGKSFLKLKLLPAKYLGKAGKLLALNAMGRSTGPDEFELIRKDGNRISVEISTTLIKQEGGSIVIGAVRDITERKRADEALWDSEEKHRAIFEQAAESIVLVDGETGALVEFNDRAYENLGYTREEFEKLKIPDFEIIESVEEVMKHIEKIIKEGSDVFETQHRTKDGEIRDIQVSSKPIHIGGSNFVQSIWRDITEQKKAEEREKQLQQELNLASRLATVGEMSSGIAHEINNPLTGVIGFSQLLMKKDLPEDIKKDVRIIYEGAQRVAGITSRMLTFARQHRPDRASVNINDIVETTLAMRAYEASSSGINVTTRLDPDLPTTMADASQLQQVFLNIILNAEVEMITAHGKGNLSVKTERIGNTIRVSFKDDGPGIPKKNLDKIFDPFFTTREVGQGSGLGLSVCHGIISEHRGKIYARSTLGKGATFFVELPVVTKAEQLKMAEPAAEVPKTLSRARILVVDDDTIVQEFLTEVLREEGHQVEIVENGDDALERIDSEDYDVILLDIKLPGMSGIELYKYMQKTVKSLTRRVIFITGDVMSKDTMDFLSRTSAPYIAKPFDAEQLKKDIDRILTEGA